MSKEELVTNLGTIARSGSKVMIIICPPFHSFMQLDYECLDRQSHNFKPFYNLSRDPDLSGGTGEPG